MSSPQQQPPSMTWEIVIATAIGIIAGVGLGNYVVGAGIGIALGIVLSVLKMVRAGGRR